MRRKRGVVGVGEGAETPSTLAVIALTAVTIMLATVLVAHSQVYYSCNTTIITENSSMMTVKFCTLPTSYAIFVKLQVGAYYINSTTLELLAYWINGSAATENFTLINYYNSSQVEKVTITGNGTATVWSNKTIVVFTEDGVNFAFIARYIPGLTLPSSFTYTQYLALIPIAVAVGLAARGDRKAAGVGMLLGGVLTPLISLYLGYQASNAVLNFIGFVLVFAGGVILWMDWREETAGGV